MALFYVDPSAGSDGNPGTEAQPFRTFSPINMGGWSGHEIRIRRGTRLALTSTAERANIEAAGGCLLSAYGSGDLPVIDSQNLIFNPVWPRSGSGIVVERLHVTNAPGNGIAVSPITGQSLTACEVRDCLVTNANLRGMFGADAIYVGLSQVDGGQLTNMAVRRCVSRDSGGHGMKMRGNVIGGVIEDCVAINSGLRSPAHGIGTSGAFVDVMGGWTNVSGTTWERAVTVAEISSVSFWRSMYVLGAAPLYRLPYSATPATPGAGECGIGANNTIRVNLGGQNPNTLTGAIAIYLRPFQVWVSRCVAINTFDANGLEGDGIYFDNGSERCFSLQCVSVGNQGNGQYLNDATDCGHYGGINAGNAKGGAACNRGVRCTFAGNAYANAGSGYGIRFATGTAAGRALRNLVANAAQGVVTSDVGTNSVTEDENLWLNVGTPVANVATSGGRSAAIPALPAYSYELPGWASRRITEALALQ